MVNKLKSYYCQEEDGWPNLGGGVGFLMDGSQWKDFLQL